VRLCQELKRGFRARRRHESVFFFEKKNQKTFDWFGCGLFGWSGPGFVKVFWFFFFKKEPLAFL
jgi:hypothetical protein